MAIQAGVGMSSKEDAYQAGYESCAQAIGALGSETPGVVLLFADISYEQDRVIEGAREMAGAKRVVGCSSNWQIANGGPYARSVVAMAIWSDSASFIPGLAEGADGEAHKTGQRFAKEISEQARDTLNVLIMFPDVISNDGSEIIRGILDELGGHVPVVGGAAADDFSFKKTYEYFDTTVTSGALSGMGITGTFSMGLGVAHGWMPIGLPMTVTKSKGVTLYELDGKPALSVYEEYFGEKAKELHGRSFVGMAITYPLGIKIPESGEYIIRYPIAAGEDGSITCLAEVPEGSEVRLMIGSKEKAIEAAREAARKLMRDFEAQRSSPKCVLVCNCIARERLMMQGAHEEIRAVADIIGKEVPLAGFYTYGGFASLSSEILQTDSTHPIFLNETIILFALGD